MRPDKIPAAYMMASHFRGTLYVGVTSNLPGRDHQHKHGLADGFTKKHGCKLLVWYEFHETMEQAILREKQLKAGSRRKKIERIEKDNPYWHNLSQQLHG
jgi:putative endonuclease